MDIVQVGPLTIKVIWIIYLLAGAVAYFVIFRAFKDNQLFQQQFLDSIINAVIICFLTFKFSFVLFNFQAAIKNPISILYFSGGLGGIILGFILAAVYIFFKYRKYKWEAKSVLTASVYGIVTFLVSFWMMRTLFLLFF